MKKALSFLLAICLLLVGCTSAPADNTDEGPAPDHTGDAPIADYTGEGPISDEIVHISILGGNARESDINAIGLPFYENLYAAAGVEPELELLDIYSYDEAVRPRLAAGVDLADIIRIPGNDVDMSYIQAGLFVELSDLIEKYGYNMKPALEAYGASLDDLRTPDGNIYYVPMLSDATTLTTTLHLNVQWLEALDLKIPTTVDELYDVLKAFKEKDANGNGDPNDEIPLSVKRADYLKLMGAFWGIDLSGGYYMDDNGVVQSSYASENYRAYLTYMHKLYEEGLLDPEFASNSTDILTNYCSQDILGSMYAYMTDGHSVVSSNPHFAEDTPVMLGIKPLTSEFVSEGFYWSNDPIASLFGISRECEDPETVFKFLDYCFSGREQWIEEDVDIALTCNHLPVALIPEAEYDIIPTWMVECDQELQPYHRAPLNIRYYTKEELDVIDTYLTDIQTYTDENYLKFISGDRSLDEFDDYVRTLESIDNNAILEIYRSHFGG